eukprot:Blabericola_migrator_1__2121@NODE_1586_length_4224_cov_94_207602_g1036_i0_p2_GENE_NODE_1586_length_4224_cov_94_207602_g1036_i0NODE_1586_length_4224_cov_94_207602_g1036_i0_p2_ORF_typecomplete_len242_score74_21DeoC/PF01791_9/9e39GGDEF/PF00990_21/0_19GGDEF/PF00990_21/6_2e02His_biosynth/PF00977_21/1_3e02His_biosynth/PF00977_21/1_2e02His_biosynth/PF00977_21/0_98FMN_dh/PF01070_18/0_052PNPase/PF03726_14/0_21ThiG/PF05690_14/8_5e02ThiG/PF05690_14/0_68_NODE_1586_length_4224_cov_94_207602_g1036_i0166891
MDKLIASCLDVTTLSDVTDTVEKTQQLASDAVTINAAAVCVYPQFVKAVRQRIQELGGNVKTATVVNFPRKEETVGHDVVDEVKSEIAYAVAEGCDEIDFVFPYRIFMEQTPESKEKTKKFVTEVIEAIPKNVVTKAILESGIMSEETLLRSAAQMCIDAGVNYLKTSTGKAPVGARSEEVKILAQEIVKSGQPVGLKVSGGVRTKEDALKYLELARDQGMIINGPKEYRVGASKLHQTFL